ncbi:hypothetical protein DPX16_15529 [Anabarilius grahami]|uniref:Uncharacterized protein n=1 Tax=Anabarilius grahami TaxID=495550 RepID=A0A3N0XCQ1_ANAGA|nr:hypothetical protein DPX16_15529 [Anabarilius grahami]
MRESWKRDGAGDLWRRWSTHTQTRNTRGDRESQETDERVVETGWSWRSLETMEHSHTDEEHTGRSGVTGDRREFAGDWGCSQAEFAGDLGCSEAEFSGDLGYSEAEFAGGSGETAATFFGRLGLAVDFFLGGLGSWSGRTTWEYPLEGHVEETGDWRTGQAACFSVGVGRGEHDYF